MDIGQGLRGPQADAGVVTALFVSVTSSEQVGKAMLRVAHDGGAAKAILEPADINAL